MVAFLDDDIVPGPQWAARLTRDLRELDPDVSASQGRIEVPLLTDRRPTDVERGTAGLASARWITADTAYHRAALQRVSAASTHASPGSTVKTLTWRRE